jgi:tRNA-specific 2-thiouridylase
MKGTQKTVFVGLSGGVDSSVAAHLLKAQGYNVVGVFIRCYNVDGCAERDAEDARRVAEHIAIPFYTFDLEEEYKQRVVHYMVEGYRAGFTPNPDVMCNREIKFGLFLEKALAMGADYVATGHYVRKYTMSGRSRKEKNYSQFTTNYKLFVAKDANKDQSYFLWTLTQRQLAHCLFPIGGYEKQKVRAIAQKAGLPTAAKKDSQGICFLGQVGMADFLAAYIPVKQGKLVTSDGRVVGAHQGAQFVTVGQRTGYRLPVKGYSSPKGREQRPMYVVAKDVKTNTVTVAEGRDNPLLYKEEVSLKQVNFISPLEIVPLRETRPNRRNLKLSIRVFARLRYREPLAPAILYFPIAYNLQPVTCRLVFDVPQQFVADGQSAVWYSKTGEMLGGGVIASSK